jgi:uncharacterized membrane protein
MRAHANVPRSRPAAANGSAQANGDPVAKNIEDVVRIEKRDRAKMGWGDHLADAITAFGGSMEFVWLHVGWFSVWIAVNVGLFGLAAFDEFPFGLLTTIVSLEAIFLSTFVLISQNREAKQADRRARLDLQINMLAEQEVTRLTKMISDIHERLGLQDDAEEKAELEEMKKPVRVDDLVKAVDMAEGDD